MKSAKVQKSRITKTNGAIARYSRVGSLSEEIALIPGGFHEFSKCVRALPLRDKKFEWVEAFFKEVPPNRQNGIELEKFSLEFGVSPAQLLGACVEILYEKKRNIAKMIQSVAMPAVIKRNVRQAKTADGVEDRRMFMLSTGLLPTPRGSNINISNTAQAGALTNEGEFTGLPDFEESTVRFSEVIRNAAETVSGLLPEPVPDAIIADSEDEDAE